MVVNVGDEVVKRDSGSKKKLLVKTESYQLNRKVFGKSVADKNQTTRGYLKGILRPSSI